MYRLINAGPSPYGRKVAVALHEKGIAFETVLDLPWAEAHATRVHSPLEQLPILLPDDGEAVYDSSFILDWLEWTHPLPALLPKPLPARLIARRQQVLGERLMEIAQSLIFEHHRPDPAQATIERQTRKIGRGLAAAEQLVGQDSPGEGPPHLGRIALGTTLLCWEFVVAQGMTRPLDVLVWRSRFPALTALIERLETRPSFLATRPLAMDVDITGEVA